MAVYINSKNPDGSRETIDEFPTRRIAMEMLSEYRMAYPYGNYYLSSRMCANWRD